MAAALVEGDTLFNLAPSRSRSRGFDSYGSEKLEVELEAFISNVNTAENLQALTFYSITVTTDGIVSVTMEINKSNRPIDKRRLVVTVSSLT